MTKITFTQWEKNWLNVTRFFSLPIPNLPWSLQFCWKMRYWSQKWISFEIQGVERQKQSTKVWRATAATTNWSYSKRTGNWKGSWRGKKISRWAKRKRAERKKIKQKKEGWLQSKINNLNVSQKLKKKKQTKKSCEVGFKN